VNPPISIKFLAIESHLESVLEMFPQLDKDCLILPIESMPIYSIIKEADEFIDSRRNQRPLVDIEREWTFGQRNRKNISL
jgi:hypothetical protein